MSPATTKIEATASKMPTFTTSHALSMLWGKAANKLRPDELKWFADGAAQQVSTDTYVLADVLMDIGCLVLADDGATGAFLEAPSASNLMFNLSSQLSTISGLANIAIEARYLAHRELKGQP